MPAPPTWRVFSFALHLLRVQGFSFCPAAYQPRTSVYSGLYAIHAIYTTIASKPFTGLCSGISIDLPHSSAQQYSSYTSRPIIIMCIRVQGCVLL